MPADETDNLAMKFAIKLLMLRRRSNSEMRGRLEEKGFPPAQVAATMGELERLRYLDDAAFAESYINDRINLRPAGRYLIRQELRAKGLDKTLIDQKLDELLDRERELSLARRVADKKRRLLHTDDRRKAAAKLVGFLRGRGFSSEIISQLTRNDIESEQD